MDKPTLEELKRYAKEYGYHLMPIPKYIKKLPCTCGRKRIVQWHTRDGLYWMCPVCGKKSPVGKSDRDSRRKWNEMIQNELLSMPK